MHRASSGTCAEYTLPAPHLHGPYSETRDKMNANGLSETTRASSQLARCHLLLTIGPHRVNAFHGKPPPPQGEVSLLSWAAARWQQLGSASDKSHLRSHCLSSGKCRHNPQVSGRTLALGAQRPERTALQIRPSYNHLPSHQGNATPDIVTLVTEKKSPSGFLISVK